MNGPWFTVQQTGDWKELGSFWLSNGSENVRATVELKLQLPDPRNESTAASSSSKPVPSQSNEGSR